MLESELQAHIEELVAQDALATAIENSQSADPSMYSHANEMFIPEFPIDFLMRRNALLSARHVLDRLYSLEQISTSSASISLDRSERLFPDLLLCNPDCGVFILLELKRSGQTARETITELLAYEHEIRNHLPFLSNLDVCHVIVSTEFTPLLDHAVAGLVTWESKQVLCLQASQNEAEIKLQVHIPRSWTSIGQRPLPADSISTAVLCLYEDDEVQVNDEIPLLRAANMAIDMIAREGDRSNSHGFVMLWEDAWYGEMFQARFNLSIGVVNPFSFVPAAVESGFLTPEQSPLANYVMTGQHYLELCPDDSVHGTVCEKAIHLLKEQCRPMWERFSSWDHDRAPTRSEDALVLGLNHRAIPVRFEFWGSLGDFARQYITMPAVRNALDPTIRKHGLDWRDPSVAIELLDRLTGMDIVRDGKFDCKTMFEVGMATGAFLSISRTAAATPDDEQNSLPALFAWHGAIFACAIKEIRLRWMSTPAVPAKPPTVRFACENGSPTFDDVQELIAWICDEFLEGFNIHRMCFQLGLQAVYILDPYFAIGAGEDAQRSIIEEIVDFGHTVISQAVNAANDDDIADDIRSHLRGILESTFPETLNAGELSSVNAEEISKEHLVDALSGSLFELLDAMYLPVVHAIADMAPMSVDWQWLRDQVSEMRNLGVEHPGVVVAADGAFGVGDLGDGAKIFKYDPIDEVLVYYEIASSTPWITRRRWKELEAGDFFAQGDE